MPDDLDRLRVLAGIAKSEEPERVLVMLPELPAAEMRRLLDRLKEIADEPREDWTVINIDGVRYRATGVTRDLPDLEGGR